MDLRLPMTSPNAAIARMRRLRCEDLRLGAWCFPGAWSLVLGAFSRGAWSLVLGVFSLLCSTAFLHATAPQLASISPAGAQRGAELEVNFSGERLQDAEEIICYEPGIQ